MHEVQSQLVLLAHLCPQQPFPYTTCLAPQLHRRGGGRATHGARLAQGRLQPGGGQRGLRPRAHPPVQHRRRPANGAHAAHCCPGGLPQARSAGSLPSLEPVLQLHQCWTAGEDRALRLCLKPHSRQGATRGDTGDFFPPTQREGLGPRGQPGQAGRGQPRPPPLWALTPAQPNTRYLQQPPREVPLLSSTPAGKGFRRLLALGLPSKFGLNFSHAQRRNNARPPRNAARPTEGASKSFEHFCLREAPQGRLQRPIATRRTNEWVSGGRLSRSN